MYDENGHKIAIGHQVVGVKTIAKKTRIYEGMVKGISHYRPQVLVHVIKGGGNHWFNASQVAVQVPEVFDENERKIYLGDTGKFVYADKDGQGYFYEGTVTAIDEHGRLRIADPDGPVTIIKADQVKFTPA